MNIERKSHEIHKLEMIKKNPLLVEKKHFTVHPILN